MAIRVNLNPLKAKTTFPYLRRTILCNNSDWADFYSNLSKARRRLGVVSKVMGKTGYTIRFREMMYKAVVYVFLLYGVERWVLTDSMMTVL